MKDNTIQRIIYYIVLCICAVPALLIIFIYDIVNFAKNVSSNEYGYQPRAPKNHLEPPKGTSGEDA